MKYWKSEKYPKPYPFDTMNTKSKKTKKYLIVGGYVYSKIDGEEHYVSPIQLAKLHKLNPNNPNVKLVTKPEDVYGINLSEYIIITPNTLLSKEKE